jgi:hypothetical protein
MRQQKISSLKTPSSCLKPLRSQSTRRPADGLSKAAPTVQPASAAQPRLFDEKKRPAAVHMNPTPVIDWSKQPVEFWSNSTYFVCAYRDHCNEIGLMAIRRHDWAPCSDWRDKLAIKNQIVGAE